MWLIENDDKRFLSDRDDVGYAARELRRAQERRHLTLVVGNGPSQSAAWLHSARKRLNGAVRSESAADVSWSGVVKKAAKIAGVPSKFYSGDPNYLALAQAVMTASKECERTEAEARQALLSSLNTAFNEDIEPTIIDEMLVRLGPADIVTTNYDFQLERAFERFAPGRWAAFVRHGQGRPKDDGMTWIHKMHGSFSPRTGLAAQYRFSESFSPERPDASIVITESDYAECYREIGQSNVDRASLMLALSRTCLIIGKSLHAQDLSFMYALRKARPMRNRAGNKAFMIFNDPLTQAEELNLYNLDIIPLVINLPRLRSSGHFYFGLAGALDRLIPLLTGSFERATQDTAANFTELVRGPDVIAIGLASHNITGRTSYQGDNIIPPPGRRNLRYADVEEHTGGSAMVPLVIFSSLDQAARRCKLSMVSAVGGELDLYSETILRTCHLAGIDTDAVSRNQAASWHSTVLVHTSQTHEGLKYSGQRIFLDRGYDIPTTLERAEIDQLHAQLSHTDLRLVYLDKFLAAQHPPLTNKDAFDASKLGPILQASNLEVLRQAVEARPEIDILYETGGGGSPFQHVEVTLREFISVFTASFPFFASVILHKIGWELPDALKLFHPLTKWWEADFAKETEAIAAVLPILVNKSSVSRQAQRVWRFHASPALCGAAGAWVGRASSRGDFRRRWFITTLHHYGALGIDLVRGVGWYCRIPDISDGVIHNTSGAGDTFRGALMFSILSAKAPGEDELPRALVFATDVATEKCRHFSFGEACTEISKKFGDIYSEYEAMDLP